MDDLISRQAAINSFRYDDDGTAWDVDDIVYRLEQFPSAQPELYCAPQLEILDDGTLMMTVPQGMLEKVKRVMVDEVGTKNCKMMYQDEPEQEILDELMDIMKEYYFTHRYEYDEAWENGFAKCMNLIPNVYMKRGKDR